LETTEIALIADAHEDIRPHVRVANRAAAIAFVAQSAYRDARLFPTHDEVWVVFGHL